jgi:hypothetical protein
MERVLYNLHHQICSFALRRTSSRTRSLAEHSLLVLALCGFGALLLAHVAFVYRGNTRLEMNNGDGRPLRNIPLTCLSSIPGFMKDVDITHLSLVEADANGMPESRAFHSWFLDNDPSTSTGTTEKQDGLICESTSDTTGSCPAVEEIKIIYSFSKVKGYLLVSTVPESNQQPHRRIPNLPFYSHVLSFLLTLKLPTEVCAQHNVSVQYVMVSKTDIRCFGEPFLQQLIFRLLAPDSVMLNWLLATHNATGFVYDPRTEAILDLSQHYSLQNNNFLDTGDNTENNSSRYFSIPWHQQLSSKLAVVLKTSFLFFIITTLVSFTLRETQERMLGFTLLLQAHVRARRPVLNIVTMHIAENLVFVPIMVGMIFFLIEFYRGDKFLAFMVLSIVWLCEVFSVISLRSSQGIHFFPRIFFLLFAVFHFYLFSFPFGFSYTALASTGCFMAHSMLFFWHRYELPAVALGLVTVEQPRMGNSIPPLHTDQQRPSAALPLPPQHQFVRQLSHGTAASSLGRGSRQASSTGLFNAGDDGDESYMYFMDGEVVMHREDRSHHSESARGSIGDANATGDGPGRVGGIPDRILAEVGVLDHSITSDRMDNDDELFHSFDEEHVRRGLYHGGGGEIVDPPETSALQAILDVHGTPRTDNLSNANANTTIVTAPVFPHLPAYRRRKSGDSSLESY